MSSTRTERTARLTSGRYELLLAEIDYAALVAAFPQAEVSRDAGGWRLLDAFDDERLAAAVHRIALLGGRVLGILSVDRRAMPVRS